MKDFLGKYKEKNPLKKWGKIKDRKTLIWALGGEQRTHANKALLIVLIT